MTGYPCQIQAINKTINSGSKGPLGEAPERPSNLTVGRLFNLACEGNWSNFDWSKAEFILNKDDKYKIKFINGKTSDSGAMIMVTSYEPGNHKLNDLSLTSGGDIRALGNLEFQVNSVIESKDQELGPYGPIGPFELTWPWWVHIFWVVLLIGVIALGFRRWRHWEQKRILLEEFKKQDSALTPFAQFNQSLRRIQRNSSIISMRSSEEWLEGSSLLAESVSSQKESIPSMKECVDELEKSYRLFLGRSFLIPTFHWNINEILADLKKSHYLVYSDFEDEIRGILREFETMRKKQFAFSEKDFQQLFRLVRKNGDDIYLHLKNRKD